MQENQSILVAGEWKTSDASSYFQASNPALSAELPAKYPVSRWSDCEQALQAAVAAAETLRRMPRSQVAAFLEAFARLIENQVDSLAQLDEHQDKDGNRN